MQSTLSSYGEVKQGVLVGIFNFSFNNSCNFFNFSRYYIFDYADILMELLKNPYACAFCEDSFSQPIYLVNHVQYVHVTTKHFGATNGIGGIDNTSNPLL